MEDKYEALMKIEIRSAENSVNNGIERIEEILRRVKHSVEFNRSLNDLGELQSTATIFDCDVTRLATLRKALANYREMKE